MKPFNVTGQRQRINVAAWLIIGADCLMMLAALMLALPPQSYELSVVAPHIASAVMMAGFGPYLFVASGNTLLTILLMVVHLVLLAFDLVLAGHAHGGQWLIPFVGRGGYSPNQHFFPKYVDGSYRLANGGEMLVSRGLARESTPLPRLFNPPEILSVKLDGR